MNNLNESLKWRYACKAFDATKELSDEQISGIKENYNLTASSFGLQPFKLVVVKNRAIREQLVEHSWNQQQVADASHLLVLATRTDLDNNLIASYVDRTAEVRGVERESLNAFEGMMQGYFAQAGADNLNLWAKSQSYICMGNLLAYLASEKIDSCPMEGFTPEKYDEILGLGNHNLTASLIIPIGYRSEEDKYASLPKVRAKIEDIVVEL
ncbi:MAG: NAD(P)H-dependent oxidoreductase [Flavobacteriales bacterium]|jgi:nitroreductase|nr:NAD(P)H-dependent oxidoreductase [Flavobacteriales bacterium]